jgi:hypothetical protein
MNKEELDEYPDYEALDIEAINSILDEDERQGMLEYISQLEQENTDLKQKISKAIEYISENKIQKEYTDISGFRCKEEQWFLEDTKELENILESENKK